MNQIDIEKLTSRKSLEKFPNYFLDKPNDTIPVIVQSLEPGEYQLITEAGGKRKVIAKISKSAYNVDRLLRCTGSLIYRKSSEESFKLSSVTDYLELV